MRASKKAFWLVLVYKIVVKDAREEFAVWTRVKHTATTRSVPTTLIFYSNHPRYSRISCPVIFSFDFLYKKCAGLRLFVKTWLSDFRSRWIFLLIPQTCFRHLIEALGGVFVSYLHLDNKTTIRIRKEGVRGKNEIELLTPCYN